MDRGGRRDERRPEDVVIEAEGDKRVRIAEFLARTKTVNNFQIIIGLLIAFLIGECNVSRDVRRDV